MSNGSFESALTGWSGLNAQLVRVGRARSGNAAARVSLTGAATDFSIYSPRRVPAVAGTVYSATAWVRSSSGEPVCLRLREWLGGDDINAAERCVRPRANWRKFPAVTLSVRSAGHEVDVYAYRLGATPGSRFDIDGLTLLGKRVAPAQRIPTRGPTLIAVGDIAKCGDEEDEATAELVERIHGTIATLGDNAYHDGTREEFARCYGPSWGRYKARTRPSPGNHEYHSRGAAPYFAYFGAAAGPAGRGYYSYRVGTWHVISLNSNCDAIGGCHRGSAQERWLRANLRANRRRCTLAYWHHARFSSGSHGSDDRTDALFRALYAARADVVLTGHDHNYERFAPQRPDGTRDRRRGIRQFVVGTGGADLRSMGSHIRNSEVRNSDTHGVLVLTLRRSGYSWRFFPVTGKSFVDSGSGACH